MLRSDYRPAAFAVMDCFRREVAARTRTILNQIAERTGAAEARPTSTLSDGVAKWPAPSSPSTFAAEMLPFLPVLQDFPARGAAGISRAAEALRLRARPARLHRGRGAAELPSRRARRPVDEFLDAGGDFDVRRIRSGQDGGRAPARGRRSASPGLHGARIHHRIRGRSHRVRPLAPRRIRSVVQVLRSGHDQHRRDAAAGGRPSGADIPGAVDERGIDVLRTSHSNLAGAERDVSSS